MRTRILNYNLKQAILLLFLVILFKGLNAQSEPAWMMEAWRAEQYPSNVYIIGYAQDEKNKDESISEAIERIKDLASANLSESILSSVKSINDSYKQSIMEGDSESIKETFKSEIKVTSNLKINGIRVESFVKDNMIYGFASANKYEIIGYYKANLNLQIQQIEGFINTGTELESNNEKSKAKEQFSKALPIFDQVKEAQGIISAIDKNITNEELKMQITMKLYNDVIQANARLAQGIIVYITTDEDIFGEKTIATENGLKAVLAENGCRFTKNEDEADWKIDISATSREFNYSNSVYFSYVDAEVKLFKAPSDKHVYQNEFSQKGAHSKSYKEAAIKAYKDIGKQISEKILNWINN